MQLKKIIQEIESNQTKIAAYGKFDEATLKKINYKLRLDWNYYSNRMEGGTLTKAETRSVMVGNIEVHGKPYKDVAEMKGHDDVVLEVLKMSKGELSLSEKRIKAIHSSIMFEERDDLKSQIGQWKKANNEIINYKNEKYYFTDWTDVPDKVHRLLDNTNAELERYYKGKSDKHALEIVAQFHVDFISIHPFYDGNGRTTRILSNIVLLACGYPAIVIKEEHKKAYYQLLADIQVYSGDPKLFYCFIGERVLETQRIIIDALNGREIDEPSDLDKEILLLKTQLSAQPTQFDVALNLEDLHKLIDEAIIPACKFTFEKLSEFDDQFISIVNSANIVQGAYSDYVTSDSNYLKFIGLLQIECHAAISDKTTHLKIQIDKQCQGLKKHSNAGSVWTHFEFEFHQFYCTIALNHIQKGNLIIPYGKAPDMSQIQAGMQEIIKNFLAQLKQMLNIVD
jgi:Fic family protein